MISKHILKEIITTNAEFILKYAGNIVAREGVLFPETLSKVIVLYGVRRSGKTFICFPGAFRAYSHVDNNNLTKRPAA